jgi:hypothetical protein
MEKIIRIFYHRYYIDRIIWHIHESYKGLPLKFVNVQLSSEEWRGTIQEKRGDPIY